MSTPGGSGRLEGFDVVAQAPSWDSVTTAVVLRRLASPAPLAFFTEAEGACAAALLDRLFAQDGEPRLHLVGPIDERLALGRTDGWRYDDMPHDAEAWRAALAALEAEADHRHGMGFADLDPAQQQEIVQHVRDCAAEPAGRWQGLPAAHVWSLWTRYGAAAFYAHPWAWNEIGFGGPAYPRGYKHIGLDAREPWERPSRPGQPGS